MYHHVPQLLGKLTVKDFGKAGQVKIIINSGAITECFCMFDTAFVVEERIAEKTYIVVYTEHCGYHSFLKTEDLSYEFVKYDKS